jgi:hypothetical protein
MDNHSQEDHYGDEEASDMMPRINDNSIDDMDVLDLDCTLSNESYDEVVDLHPEICDTLKDFFSQRM